VLNVQADHLGLKGIETLEQLAEVKRIVVEVARDCAVLNADDENTIRMSAHTDAKHLCYVTLNPNHALVREHVRAGGRACGLEAGVNGQMITLYDKGRLIPLMWTHLIPATLEGRAMHNVQNAMFAAALAFSLDIKLDAIRQALRTFDSTFFQAPGRMNVYDEHPFKVIFDYAHNAHAVGAMADLASRLDVRGRRIVVVAGPGDRRDEDIRAIAREVAGRFDRYICRRDDGLRGRADDEIPRMIASTLRELGVAEEAIDIIPDEQAAIEAALRMGEPGDLILVFADALTRSWKQIIKFKPQGEGHAGEERDAATPGSGAVPPSADRPAASSRPSPGAPAPAPFDASPRTASRAGAPASVKPSPPKPLVAAESSGSMGSAAALEAQGFVREERGLRFVGETAD
jgi:cyanophycin synthetase